MPLPRLLLATLFATAFLVLAGCGGPQPTPVVPEPKEAPAAKTTPAETSTAALQAQTLRVPCAAVRTCTDCPNDTFIPTDCMTTAYGPARANVITVEPGVDPQNAMNMLRCQGGNYAMCFYSGPPTPTDRAGKAVLPCVVNEKTGMADCTCQAYTGGDYYVDIHAISNLRVYYQTVDVCGRNGENCINLANCPAGSDCDPKGKLVAPVCSYILNQTAAGGPTALRNDAQMISTFSFVMSASYPVGTTECPDPNADPGNVDFLYAGCMTAACSFEGNQPSPPYTGEPVQCQCPLWRGPYQVGQAGDDISCTIPPQDGNRYAWSAAYTVTPEPCTQK